MEQAKRTGRLDVNIAFFLRTSKILHEVHLYVDISSTTNHMVMWCLPRLDRKTKGRAMASMVLVSYSK